ncbi:MAG: penicillin-binding protein 2 [Patescibacteria group bacterium]|nr:penicillin-binding protein 2 [Patescibacteria group bacterium]
MRSKNRKLGLAFSDELKKVGGQSNHFKNKGDTSVGWEDNLLPNYQSEVFFTPVSSWRLVILASIFLLTFFGLFLRIFHLQIVYGQDNRERADSNRIQVKIVHAPRGVIYDRNGKVLAENNPGFRLEGDFVDRDTALMLEAKNDPKYSELEVDTIRSYPFSQSAAHILGYVGQISPEELKMPEFSGYRIGDRIGRAGIEQVYELVLRGRDGAEIIEIDAQGKKLRLLRKIDPIPGENVYLSIDADLQKWAFTALEEGVKKADSCCGAMVAEDPQSGDVLALASYPSFDNNAFTDPKRGEEISAYFNNENSPLLNRVIAGTYPPGSTFKIASALAGLSSGKITSNTQIEDTGVMSLGPYKFSNWFFTQYGKTEGQVNLVKALQRSNDIFFYRVGELVGEKSLAEVAKKIGFGKKLGIDLPGEVDGLIPSDEWKQKNYGQVWYPGDTLHMAIGQGFLLTTPLQVLAQTAFIANNGNLVEPHLVTKITTPDDEVVKQFHVEPIVKDIFKKEDLELVKKGLSEVPKDGGTAWPFFTFSVPTAGKTGTAEFGDPKNKTHAWYTTYAPVDSPSITLTVLVEAGGEGSSVAAPIAKQIYTWYFNTDKNNIQSLDTGSIASSSAKTLGE